MTVTCVHMKASYGCAPYKRAATKISKCILLIDKPSAKWVARELIAKLSNLLNIWKLLQFCDFDS